MTNTYFFQFTNTRGFCHDKRFLADGYSTGKVKSAHKRRSAGLEMKIFEFTIRLFLVNLNPLGAIKRDARLPILLIQLIEVHQNAHITA